MALIPPISSGFPTVPTQAANPATKAAAAGAADGGAGFGESISKALDGLQEQQSNVDNLAQQAATGKLKNIEDYLIASNDAQLSMQLTVAVRNKAIESFNEIMRMQV